MKRIYKRADLNKLSVSDILNLNKCYLSQRKKANGDKSVFLGASSGKYGDFWFNFPDGRRGIFKTYGTPTDPINKYRNVRMVNEMFISRLLKKLNVPAAEYVYAQFKNENGVLANIHDGLLTYDVLKPGETFVNSDLACETLEQLYARLDELQKENLIADKDIKEQIYKLLVLDILTMQNDRYGFDLGRNMYFIKGENGYRFCVLDNEYAMNIFSIEQEYFHRHDENVNADLQPTNFILKNKDGIAISEKSYISQYERAEQLYELAKRDPKLMLALNEVLNLDVREVLDEMKKDGINISKPYKEYILYSVDEMHKLFKFDDTKTPDEENKAL